MPRRRSYHGRGASPYESLESAATILALMHTQFVSNHMLISDREDIGSVRKPSRGTFRSQTVEFCILVALTMFFASCSKKADKQHRCEALIENQLGQAMLAGLMGKSTGNPDSDFTASELMPYCKELPATLLTCLTSTNSDSPKCRSAFNAAMGIQDASTTVEGPTPQWSMVLAGKLYDVQVAHDRTILIALDDKVLAIKNGTELWTRELPEYSSRLALVDNCVMAPTRSHIPCLDIRTGEDLWSVSREFEETEDDDDRALVESIIAGEAAAYYGGHGGLVYSMNLSVCAKGDDCVASTGIKIADYETPQFAIATSGHWAMVEDSRARVFSKDNRELWKREGENATLGDAPADHFLVAVGNAMLKVDPTTCRQGNDACASEVGLLEEYNSGVAELASGAIVVVDAGGVVVSAGRPAWKSDIGADAFPVQLESTIYAIGSETMTGPRALYSIDPKTGNVGWKRVFEGSGGVEAPTLIALEPSTLIVYLPKTKTLLAVPSKL